MKKVIFSLLVISTMSVSAQRLPLLIKADFGISNVKSSGGSTSSKVGLGLGVETVAGISKQFIFNPGISFFRSGYETGGLDVNVNYLLLNAPVGVSLDLDNHSGQYAWILDAGPYAAFALSGKFDQGNGTKKSMSFGNGTGDNRKSFDAGLVLKSAIKVKIVYVGLQYNMGMTNLIPNDRISNGSSIRSRALLFCLSFNINGKK